MNDKFFPDYFQFIQAGHSRPAGVVIDLDADKINRRQRNSSDKRL
jgi:hypothetical protein